MICLGAVLILAGGGLALAALGVLSQGEPSAVHNPVGHGAFESAPGQFLLGLVLAGVGLVLVLK
jgi:hypothetical protein